MMRWEDSLGDCKTACIDVSASLSWLTVLRQLWNQDIKTEKVQKNPVWRGQDKTTCKTFFKQQMDRRLLRKKMMTEMTYLSVVAKTEHKQNTRAWNIWRKKCIFQLSPVWSASMKTWGTGNITLGFTNTECKSESVRFWKKWLLSGLVWWWSVGMIHHAHAVSWRQWIVKSFCFFYCFLIMSICPWVVAVFFSFLFFIKLTAKNGKLFCTVPLKVFSLNCLVFCSSLSFFGHSSGSQLHF